MKPKPKFKLVSDHMKTTEGSFWSVANVLLKGQKILKAIYGVLNSSKENEQKITILSLFSLGNTQNSDFLLNSFLEELTP